MVTTVHVLTICKPEIDRTIYCLGYIFSQHNSNYIIKKCEFRLRSRRHIGGRPNSSELLPSIIITEYVVMAVHGPLLLGVGSIKSLLLRGVWSINSLLLRGVGSINSLLHRGVGNINSLLHRGVGSINSLLVVHGLQLRGVGGINSLPVVHGLQLRGMGSINSLLVVHGLLLRRVGSINSLLHASSPAAPELASHPVCSCATVKLLVIGYQKTRRLGEQERCISEL